MEQKQLIDEIKRLKEEKNAVILAHNYELPEIQDIADYLGDSLGLARKAGETDADIIVFCGVHFMAETASIISPEKKILLPDPEAGCSLAESIKLEDLKKWKAENPDAVVVSYVNTTAEIKTETDYCCTSSNAVNVVKAIPEDKEILFLPDKFLGGYVQHVTGKKLNIWDGACHVHEKIGDLELGKVTETHPDAEILIHPECGCSTSCLLKSTKFETKPDNMHIFSTSGMIDHVNESDSKEFLVATEVGILHRMKKNNPDKEFYPASEESVCEYMKLTNLEKLYNALKNEQYEVKVDAETAKKAKLPIDRMLEIS